MRAGLAVPRIIMAALFQRWDLGSILYLGTARPCVHQGSFLACHWGAHSGSLGIVITINEVQLLLLL